MIRNVIHKVATTPQVTIGSAIGISGASQLALVFLPAQNLRSGELSDLIVWQSLSSGIGILISSVFGLLAYSNFIATNYEDGRSAFSSMLPNILKLVSLVATASMFLSIFVFDNNLTLLAITLCASLFLYLLGSIQRSVYSARGKWGPLSAQFALDGLIRFFSVAFVLWKFDYNFSALIVASLLSQAFSVLLVTFWQPWWPGINGSNEKFMIFVRRLMPLLVSTLGTLLFTTFPPVLLGLLEFSEELVAQVGLLLILIRIPTTVLTPLAIPQINDVCRKYQNGDAKAGFYVFCVTQFKLVMGVPIVLSLSLAFFSQTSMPHPLKVLFEVSHPPSLVVGFICALLLVLECFANSCLNGQGRFQESGRIYMYSSIVWTSIMVLLSFTTTASILIVLLVLVTGIAMVYVQLVLRMLPSRISQTVH